MASVERTGDGALALVLPMGGVTAAVISRSPSAIGRTVLLIRRAVAYVSMVVIFLTLFYHGLLFREPCLESRVHSPTITVIAHSGGT